MTIKTIIQQPINQDDFTEWIKQLPYQFIDTHKIDKKIDVKKMQFGSKLDAESTGKRDELFSVKEIINPENHFLKIEPKQDSDVGDYVGGRVIKGEDKTVYGSFYKKNTNEDIAILAHEIGHMLAHRLFHGKQNPVTAVYLTEVESYFLAII